MDQNLEMLITLSRKLAEPAYDLVILGEGNTSATCNDGTFWVKASGMQLATIDESGFSRVDAKAVLNLLDKDGLDDKAIEDGLKAAMTDEHMKKPSVETFLHALCLYEAGVAWVAHTHPTSVNSIICSKSGSAPFKQHIFPDEIVTCGENPLVIPYTDPGLPLARCIRDELRKYLDSYGMPPKIMLMENHGLVALGMKPVEVMNITLMADKWARIILGTYAMGGPKFLSAEQTERIETRLDEVYRRKQLTS